MFDRLSKTLTGIVAVSLFAGMALAQAPAQAPKGPAVKDQGEYDLIQSVTKEKDPQKQLALLRQWEEKYPTSDFKGQRSVSMAQADSQIMAKGSQAGAAAADVDAAQKAADDLVANMDKYLAPENKPANATDDQWKQAKETLNQQAHSVLASIAMAKKTPEGDAAAEKEFKKVLDASPGSAATAYTLGTLILREKNVARIPEALFYIARAVGISGPQALNAQGKQAAESYLEKAYAGYHGDNGGLDDLKKVAMTAATMPADLKIESVTDIQKKQEGDAAAFASAHPDIALWRQIRGALTAADGDTYFGTVKDSEIPGGANGVTMFSGKVVSQPSPKELLVNVDNATGDVTLRFEGPLKGTIDPGTDMKFKGVIDSMTKDPYNLVLTVDKEDVDGLPASAFTATTPRKRAAPKKK